MFLQAENSKIFTRIITDNVPEEALGVENNMPVLIKDVDLRIPPPMAILKDVSETNAVSSSTGVTPVLAAASSECDGDSSAEIVTTTAVSAAAAIVSIPSDIKNKRVSSGRLEEPIAKKTKSESKIDR